MYFLQEREEREERLQSHRRQQWAIDFLQEKIIIATREENERKEQLRLQSHRRQQWAINFLQEKILITTSQNIDEVIHPLEKTPVIEEIIPPEVEKTESTITSTTEVGPIVGDCVLCDCKFKSRVLFVRHTGTLKHKLNKRNKDHTKKVE